MGEINLYQDRVAPEKLQSPAVFSPSGSPTAGLAKGLDDLSGTIDQVHLQADTVAAKDADYTYRNKLLELGQSRGGYYTRKGKAATDTWQEFDSALKLARDEALAALPNDRAKRIAQASIDQSLIQERERGVRHYQMQLDAYEDQVDSGLIAAHVNGAALVATLSTPEDIEEFQGHLESIAALVRARAKRNGLDAETDEQAKIAVDAEIKKVQSDAVEGAVNTAAADGALAMVGVIQRFGSRLTGDALARVRDAYSDQIQKETVIETADQIFSSNATPEQMEAKIAPLPAVIRNEVRTLVAARTRAARSARNAAREERAIATQALLDHGVPTAAGGVRPFVMSDIPTDLAPSATRALRAEVLRREKGATSSDPEALLEAFSLSDSQLRDPDFSPFRYYGRLTQSRYEDLVKRTAEARRGETTRRGFMTQDFANSQINNIAKSLFPGTGPVALQRRAAFASEAHLQLSLQPDASYEDLNTLLARISRKVHEPRWGQDVYAFETVPYDDVPDKEKEAITNAWESAGNPSGISEDTVSDRYTMSQKTGLSYFEIESATTLARHKFSHELTELELLTLHDEMRGKAPGQEEEVLKEVIGATKPKHLTEDPTARVQQWAAKYGFGVDALGKWVQERAAAGDVLTEEEVAAVAAKRNTR